MADTFRGMMRSILDDIYPIVVSTQDAHGKSYNVQGTFTLYGQCTGRYYATLYKMPKSRYYRDADTLAKAVASWEFYYSLTQEDGKTRLITFDQEWGYSYEEWNTLHWIETLRLLKEDLPEETYRRWKARADRSCEGLYEGVRTAFESEEFRELLKRHQVANHFLWQTACVYRWAQKEGKRDVLAYCDSVMTAAAAAQLPYGTWYEGGGLVVSYAYTSFGAFAAYCGYCKNQNQAAAEALRRCVRYLSACSYDDLSAMDPIDGRNHFKKSTGMAYMAGSLIGEEGVLSFTARHLRLLRESANNGIARGHQALGFFLVSYDGMPEDAEMPDERVSPADGENFVVPEEAQNVLRHGGFRVPMCAKRMDENYLQNRWILDRSCLVSVWHEKTGLLLGGGHSKADENFASFSVTADGCTRYLPENGAVMENGISMDYGQIHCSIQAAFEDDRVTLTYKADGLPQTARVVARIPLWIQPYETITVDGAEVSTKAPVRCDCLEIAMGQARILCPDGVTVDGPRYRFNPYMQKQSPEDALRAMVLHMPLDYTCPEASVTVIVSGSK